ncbi:MAG: hypothetical protein M1820_005798 [Bogoriella megaspora]|nr:MAG: hypothetical protein M1820_005798 [Bogoriella megaspora]
MLTLRFYSFKSRSALRKILDRPSKNARTHDSKSMRLTFRFTTPESRSALRDILKRCPQGTQSSSSGSVLTFRSKAVESRSALRRTLNRRPKKTDRRSSKAMDWVFVIGPNGPQQRQVLMPEQAVLKSPLWARMIEHGFLEARTKTLHFPDDEPEILLLLCDLLVKGECGPTLDELRSMRREYRSHNSRPWKPLELALHSAAQLQEYSFTTYRPELIKRIKTCVWNTEIFFAALDYVYDRLPETNPDLQQLSFNFFEANYDSMSPATFDQLYYGENASARYFAHYMCIRSQRHTTINTSSTTVNNHGPEPESMLQGANEPTLLINGIHYRRSYLVTMARKRKWFSQRWGATLAMNTPYSLWRTEQRSVTWIFNDLAGTNYPRDLNSLVAVDNVLLGKEWGEWEAQEEKRKKENKREERRVQECKVM